MGLIAVSDLHIWGPQDPLYASLLMLIEDQTQSGDTLVLAGDVFDLFVGNRTLFTQKYAPFLEALNAATHRGVAVHYIEGNHDFHLNGVFKHNPKIQVHSREANLLLSDKRFHIAHGDLVDPHDTGYRLMRAFFRSPLVKALIQLSPASWLKAFGDWSSKTSRARNHPPPIDRREVLRKQYRNYSAEKMTQGADFIILGHCHDLDEMTFSLDHRSAHYMNIGFPRIHGSFVRWDLNGGVLTRERLPSP